MFEIGRVCMKIAGREAGKYCVIVKKMDENFVMVTGPKELTSVKRRRCNVNHLEPAMDVLNIKSDAPDNEILKAYQQANLITKLGLEPKKAKPKAAEKRPAKKESKKAEPKKAATKKPGKAAAKPKKTKK